MEQDGDMKEEEHGKRGKAVRESVSFILYLIVIVVLTFLMIRYVGQRTRVDGSSMENTLTNGDNLIVDKISIGFMNRNVLILLYFRISIRKTLILSNGLSECREKRYRLPIRERY